MSDYIPTITVQWRDYAAARKERERAKKADRRDYDPHQFRPRIAKPAPLITEVRPNPLSVELRIVLHYFWVTYNGCLVDAQRIREKPWSEGGSELAAVKYEIEALDAVNAVRDICYALFAPTSSYAPVHIHSEHGCNDETCPAWVRGGTAARDNVADWHTPDC